MKKIISVVTFLSLILTAAPAFAQSGFDMSTMYQQKTVVPDVITPILKPTSITFGAVSPEVAMYQQYLKDLGFYKGAIDGKFGIGMKTAVAGFQASYKLNADAILGQGTKDKIAMQIALAKANGSSSAQSLASLPTSVPSSNPFLNCSSMNTTPQIKVVSPNGGETFTAGQQITVKWATCNIASNVNVNVSLILPYSQNAFYAWVLGNSLPNSGQGTFTVPNTSQWGNMQYGKKFKVAVGTTQSLGNYNPFDHSDNLFTVNGAPQSTVSVGNVPSGASVQIIQNQTGGPNMGVFKIKFKVESTNDIYIKNVCSMIHPGSPQSMTGVHYSIKGNSQFLYPSDPAFVGCSMVSDSGANETSNDNFEIDAGDQETFTITTTLLPSQSGTYRMYMDDVYYSLTDSVGSHTYFDIGGPFTTNYVSL